MGHRTAHLRALVCVHHISLGALGGTTASLTSMAKLPLLFAWARIHPQEFVTHEKIFITTQVGLPCGLQHTVHCPTSVTQPFAECVRG